MVHIIMETVRPPIHSPLMTSSTPSQRDKPTPAPTAMVQTGQMALAAGATIIQAKSDMK
jgi:hypothetical protein